MVRTSYPQVQLATHGTCMSNTLQNIMPHLDTQCTHGHAMTCVYNLMSAHMQGFDNCHYSTLSHY